MSAAFLPLPGAVPAVLSISALDPTTTVVLLALCVAASAMYSGSETGLYSLSRLRLEAEVRQGRRPARLLARLLRDEPALLATVLIGNNLVLEFSAHLGEHLTAMLGVEPNWREVVLSCLLTPFLFLFAELIPKELFHRRPHALVSLTAPLIAFSKGLFLPLVLPLCGLVYLLERALGVRGVRSARVTWRDAVLDVLQESEAGQLPSTQSMASNALGLRGVPVRRAMVPWSKVTLLRAADDPAGQRAAVAACPYSRLVVVDAKGTVIGYVHGLEVLGDPDLRAPLEHLRPLISLPADEALDRALARLRAEGQRLAIVGTRGAPLGLVTVKDLVEEISGELSRW